MNQAYLLLGGNIGRREEQLNMAVNLIEERCGYVIDKSSFYETAAWGVTGQGPFLNRALVLKTKLNARELLGDLLNIETMMGRTRKEKFEPRIIDIDIIFFNHEIVNEARLVIPHPEMARRRFVLEPLNQVIPAYIHPVLYKTVSELLAECSDGLEVKRL